MKNPVLVVMASVALLLAGTSPLVAEDKEFWSGRDIDNNDVRWTCSKGVGDNWKLERNGKAMGEYEGVSSTSEFVELQMKAIKSFERVRLYKDKLCLNKEGSKTEWLEMAKGKWSK